MSRVELLPCPFCGGPAGLVQCPPTGWKVSCHSTDFSGMTNRYNCAVGAETHVLPSKAEAIAAWNRRAATSPAGDLVELVRRLDHLVLLNEPEHGGPYVGLAAQECVKAMREAATALRYQPTGVTGIVPTDAVVNRSARAIYEQAPHFERGSEDGWDAQTEGYKQATRQVARIVLATAALSAQERE